jgi:hypothetical protein
VKQSGKTIHPNFQTLDYNHQSSESKLVHEFAEICRQVHCSQENGDISAENEVCPGFNKIKYVKQFQRRYRTELGMDPPSKPSTYAFYKQFFEKDCEGKVSFAAEYTDRNSDTKTICTELQIVHISNTSKWINKF